MSKEVNIFDLGDTVLCDFCNDEWTPEMKDQGGVTVGSYAVCPKCAKGLSHPEEIDAQQPEGMTFHAWVMRLRGGNNTITVTSWDNAKEAFDAIFKK